MKNRITLMMLSLVGLLAMSASAALTPTGSYSITLTRGDWSTTIPVTSASTTSYSLIGTANGLNVSMVEEAQPESDIFAFCWYINPVVDGTSILGGSGPLTVTVDGLKFAETDEVTFQPLVTHVYYMGLEDGYYQKKWIPGASETNPSDLTKSLYQRSPVKPLTAADADYAAYGASYGTPYQDLSATNGVTFVLPDMYVPSGVNHELSFGAGFTASSPVPEPVTILILGTGLVGLVRKIY